MNLLAIETATETVSVALAINDEVLEHYAHAPRKHAELVLPWVEQLLDKAGVGLASIDAIAFSQGPGSFTSLRIGIGVVQGLAWALDRPVVPVSSLATVAQIAANDGAESVLVALDARMKEVFAGIFETNSIGIVQAVASEAVCKPGDICQWPVKPESWGVGIAFDRYPELNHLQSRLACIRADSWPRASAVIQLARDWLSTHEALPAEKAQPVYLRDNVAKKPGKV